MANRADYNIKVDFNPSTRLLKGTVSIDYINNSPDTLKYILFKLYANLYATTSPKAITIEQADLTKGVSIIKVIQDGQKVDSNTYLIRGTNMYLKNKIFLPGSKTHLDIYYNYTVNKGSFVRTGQVDSGAFFIAYFYPRVAVYDDIDGWDLYPYTGQVEFYNDYGNYNAEISVPGNYQVWGTGLLKNLDNVYQPKFAARIKKAMRSDSITSIVNESDLKEGHITMDKARNTFHFTASNVTDFAFGISNHYVYQSTSLIVDSASKRRVTVNAVYNPLHLTYRPIINYSRKTVQAISYSFPKVPYPYPHVTIFDGPDEMEFPMMVDNNPFERTRDAIQLTAHEIFHTLFPFYVGTNETKYSFMDEGWATMAEFYLHPMIAPSIPVDYDMTDINSSSGIEQDLPVITLTPQLAGAARFMDKDQKPALAYLYLKEILGDKLFSHSFIAYIEAWKGKHPTPYDFFNCINKASGQNLNWFWKNWFFEKGVPDLAIDKVRCYNAICTINILNKGTEAVPVHLKIIYADGSKKVIGASAACWQSGKKTKTFKVSEVKGIKAIILGSAYDADIDKQNNTWITLTEKKRRFFR